MKTAKKLFMSTIIWVFLFILGGIPVYAINALDASLLSQGTIPDSDMFTLMEFFGFPSGQEISNYQSTLTPSGWSATLSGTYLGTNLNVSYLGDISAFPAGPINWTSSGSYGTNSWSGNGTFLITMNTPTIFQVDLDSLLFVGGNSAITNLVFYGEEDPLTGVITYFMDPTTGEVVINGVHLLDLPIPTLTVIPNPNGTRTLLSDYHQNGVNWVWNITTLSITGEELEGSIITIPEPATMFMLGLGGLALLRRHKA